MLLRYHQVVIDLEIIEVKDLDQELKQFLSDYHDANHNFAKQKADILFNKYPKDISLFNTIGVLFLQNKKFKDAIIVFNKLLKINPRDVNIYHNLGVAWTQLNNIDEAIKFYLKAEKLNSKISLTYYNLGTLCSRKHKYEDSIIYYQKAIEINSNVAKYYYNLAWSQTEIKKYEISLESQKKAIELSPNVSKYYYNLAWIQTKLYHYDDAIENYKKAIKIEPDYPQAKFKLSLIDLVRENFLEGWKNYEERIRIKEADNNQKKILYLNQWNGIKFDGTLYVHGEQGVGDQIIYSSMVADLYKIHKNICLIVDSRFVSLFKRSFKNIKIIGEEKNIKYNIKDCHILLGSLGKLLRKSINNFSKQPRLYIIPDPIRINKYKKKFSKNNKIKVGISWLSKGANSRDRTISLKQLSKIINLENFEFINLQYGNTDNERKIFKEKHGKEIITINNLDLMNDFEGIAAVISSCDFILTIDNWIAHLSSSIGKKTLIFLPKYTFWYWLTNRSNSVWYPDVKLFRQKKYRSWKDVIDTAYKTLLNYDKT